MAAGRALAVAGDEGAFFAQAVPRTVLYQGEGLDSGVADGVEAGAVLVAEVLAPVQVVHDVGNLDEDGDELFLFLAQHTQVSGQRKLCILVNFLLNFRFFFGFVAFAAYCGKHCNGHNRNY